MILSRGMRRCAALAAAFGIALQALWPALAQARPSDSILVPICSVDGTRHEIELPIGKKQDADQQCKLCVLGADNIAVSADLPFVPGTGKDERHVQAEEPGPKPPGVLLARPRAPPQAS
jgi:hypothetical protein